MIVKKIQVGDRIATHADLMKAVDSKTWIVRRSCKIPKGGKAVNNAFKYNSYVARAYVNRSYVMICTDLKNGNLFKYKRYKK